MYIDISAYSSVACRNVIYSSQALQNGNVELTKLRDVMKLNVSCSGKEMDFDLMEVSAAERREESRTLLFTVWDSLEATKRQAGKVDV